MTNKETAPSLASAYESTKSIEQLNLKSWVMNPNEYRPFIAMSLTDVGAARGTGGARTKIAGNMSISVGDSNLLPEEREKIGTENVRNYLEYFDINPGLVKVLDAQASYDELVMVNADSEPIDLDAKDPSALSVEGDFVYTHNPDLVLAVKPGDCPIITTMAMSNDGPMLSFTHIPWRGAEAGHVERMFDCFEKLGVDIETVRMYISPGARKESYSYTFAQDPRETFVHKNLVTDVEPTDDGKFQGKIDISTTIRDVLTNNGVTDYQIFEDTSDTASLDSGFSSHSRFNRLGKVGEDSRSLFISSLRSR